MKVSESITPSSDNEVFHFDEDIKSSKVPKIPEYMNVKITKLYDFMVSQYYSTRCRKYLAPKHKQDFITGIWNSICQLKNIGITSETLTDVKNHNLIDKVNDTICNNVIFFLNDFNGEEQSIAEEEYIDFVKDNLS